MKKDFELLEALYCLYSPSNGEKKMRRFIKKECLERGASCYTDNGNLYVTKGEADTYPCVVAHMDQVQKNHSKDFKVMVSDDIIFGYSAVSKSQQGLGADDKNGIWIALQCLERFDVMKCAFFVGEEIGCVGSGKADIKFFNDVRFVIEPDRRNGGDLITSISGDICSDEFKAALPSKEFGYTETEGLMTDVEELCEKGVGVSCINFSCGYYHPHTDEECTSWRELCNAMKFAFAIIERCTDVYKHEYTYYSRYSRWDDYDWGWDYGKYLKSYKSDDKKNDVDDDDKYLSYYYEAYNHDYEAMNMILESEPYLSFEDVMKNYQAWFHLDDMDELEGIYSDVVYNIEQKYYAS